MADWLAVAGIERIVLGLETVAGPHVVAEVGSRWGLERVVFSLDLQSGRPLGNLAAWNQPDAKVIAAQAIALGVRHLLVLDLARVGTSEGTGTEELCTWLAATYPPVEVIAGGGVRDVSDLRRLQKCGVRAVLVASALHDGRLTPEDLVPLAQSQCE
jgi:phosphoribosylformimino-5-aminoimidazole carboxamide ribotide isomerase